MQYLSNKELHECNTKGLVSKKLSKNYAPVDSSLLLAPFLSKGWTVTRKIGGSKGKKVWFTLENESYTIGEDKIRIEIINSYDGSQALQIAAGIGRLICANGLVFGTDFEQFRYVHRGNRIYTELEDTYDKIINHINTLKGKIEQLNNIYLTPNKINDLVVNIYKNVFESDGATYKREVDYIGIDNIDSILRAHRIEDEGKDAYSILNVVQENIIRNGRLKCSIKEYNKKTKSTYIHPRTRKASEGKMSSMKLNKIITNEFMQLVA